MGKKKGMSVFHLAFTNMSPQPVGKNARQQTMMSFRDNLQTTERVIITDRTPRKRNALKSRNTRWYLALNCCLPMFTACNFIMLKVKLRLKLSNEWEDSWTNIPWLVEILRVGQPKKAHRQRSSCSAGRCQGDRQGHTDKGRISGRGELR